MIRLYRNRNEANIPSIFRGKERIDLNKELLEAYRTKANDNTYRFSFDDKIWKKAKPQLMQEANYKCAYCEKIIDTSDRKGIKSTSYADVEHFRPKNGGYEWLVYCYDNYLYACEVCNRSYKRADFPILGKKYSCSINPTISNEEITTLAPIITPDAAIDSEGMKWIDFEKEHQQEQPLLLDPYIDNPEAFLGYEYDDTLKEVSIVVLPSVAKAHLYQEAIEKYLGLNRQSLKDDRYTHFKHFVTYKKLHLQTEIDKMKAANYPYAGMIRYFDKILVFE